MNGLRSVAKKGFLTWLHEARPDVLLLQETRVEDHQIPKEILEQSGYQTFWFSSRRKKGYSGTAIFSRSKPDSVSYGFDGPASDDEGRIIAACFGDLLIYNVYFPNGKASPERLKFKMDFYEAFQKKVVADVKSGKKVLIGGDVNTAHHPIDLARPKDNEEISGFLPMERAWMDRFEAAGFFDIFRIFHPEPDQYTWWSMRSGARARNVGWRIDYFYASENLRSSVKDAFILPDVPGSDHCPIGVNLEHPSS